MSYEYCFVVIKNTRRAGGSMLTAVNLSTSTALV